MRREDGFIILGQGEYFERVTLGGLTVSLISSGDGTEIIQHELTAGAMWSITPSPGWSGLEFISIVSGELECKSKAGRTLLVPGNKLFTDQLNQDLFFIAKTDVVFLYIASQPVFMNYSRETRELLTLAQSIESKDGYTANHCHRIMELSMAVADIMGLPPSQRVALNIAALFHDLGKVRVPEEVLNKPGKFTPEEWEIVKKHAEHGRDILKETGLPFLNVPAEIVAQHHERHNGSGYPLGLAGTEIMTEAAIVAVVDSFDAIVSARVYKSANTIETGLAEIQRCRGTLYRPDVVDAFLQLPETILRGDELDTPDESATPSVVL